LPNRSRRKGKVGEREVAALIEEVCGGRAYAMGGSRDVRCTALAETHIEVKRRRRIALLEWAEQAERDAAAYGMPRWCVLMREDAKPGGKVRWYVLVDAKDWFAERGQHDGGAGGQAGEGGGRARVRGGERAVGTARRRADAAHPEGRAVHHRCARGRGCTFPG
jgi:hypothetical protein